MIGTTLSHFKITAKLGEGGMGAVYRAEDARLGRDVAIKVLPAAFTQDAERLARFEREAKVLASLTHQNIGAIYQVEQVEDTHFLVMEMVEGETLAARLGRGVIPVDEGLPIALQIAEALEAAHEKTVIHRDLKPANIMLTPEGQVKVLDFGLAKAWAPEGGASAELSNSPTLTAQMTTVGTILGTAGYMSPEQAKGKPVDRRADIWAFGVVLWEMLTGRRLFAGETAPEVMAAVLMSELDMTTLPTTTPPRIRRLLERCLQRDPHARLRDIGEARIVLQESLALSGQRAIETPAALHRPRRARPAIAALLIAVGVVLGAGLMSVWSWQPAPDPAPVTRVAIPMRSTLRVVGVPLLTPDGRTAVFRAVDVDPTAADHRPNLYVRPLAGDELVQVAESGRVNAHALSPDGRWVAFVTPASQRSSRFHLVKAPLDGSAPPLKIADWPDPTDILVWPVAETILGLRVHGRVIVPFSADGGGAHDAVGITADVPVRDVLGASALPDGQYLLVYFSSFTSGAYRQDVGVLDSTTGNLRTLVDDAARPAYASSGHLVFSRRDILLAAPFDLQRLEVTGGARAVAGGLWAEGLYTGGRFSLSASGDLLYGAGQVQGMSRSLATVTRAGEVTAWSGDRLYFNNVWVSPDGRRLATEVDNVGEGDALLQIRFSAIDVPRLVTVGAQPGKDCGDATWSTDSERIAYLCWDQESTRLYATRLDGTPSSDVLLEEPAPSRLELVGFSATDSRIFLRRVGTAGAVELISIAAELHAGSDPDTGQIPLDEDAWSGATLSPDGRWLAYVSDEAGRRDLFVRKVLSEQAVGPRFLAAAEVGGLGGWSKTMVKGRYELLVSQDEQILSIAVATEPQPTFMKPQALDIDLFGLGVQDLDSLPDGRLVVIRSPDTERGAPELRLVLNWAQELARLVPVPAR